MLTFLHFVVHHFFGLRHIRPRFHRCLRLGFGNQVCLVFFFFSRRWLVFYEWFALYVVIYFMGLILGFWFSILGVGRFSSTHWIPCISSSRSLVRAFGACYETIRSYDLCVVVIVQGASLRFMVKLIFGSLVHSLWLGWRVCVRGPLLHGSKFVTV